MYERVVVGEVSQYVVAEEEKLTQGYVSKRVRRVIEWMGRVGNKEYGTAPADEKLRYLQWFAEKKYDHYRREAEAAFRDSRQDMVIIKERGTRQAAVNDDEKNVGKFVGEVKIEKTIRPREGKPQFLREARLGVENLVLLACHVVARQELPLPSEPDRRRSARSGITSPRNWPRSGFWKPRSLACSRRSGCWSRNWRRPGENSTMLVPKLRFRVG